MLIGEGVHLGLAGGQLRLELLLQPLGCAPNHASAYAHASCDLGRAVATGEELKNCNVVPGDLTSA